jgi:hypothetical protein
MVIEGTEVRFRMEVWIAALIAAVTGFLGVVWATVQAASTRAVESAIDNANWSTKLGQELEKTRGVARQELRFQSYDRLWTALKPLALYSDEKVDRARIEKLSKDLSDWYFSALGGMYMTPHVREYYFALQDLLAAAARFPDWTATRTAGQEGKRFIEILDERQLEKASTVRKKFQGGPPPADALFPDSKSWREDVGRLAGAWSELSDKDRFIVLQQVGSQLRTILATDVESRMP